jgi:excisionase family DNA binding protein
MTPKYTSDLNVPARPIPCGETERRRRISEPPAGFEPHRLADRLALRPKEAAEALGISERTFRQLLPEIPTVRRGNIVLVPVAGLQEWLREESEAEKTRGEKAVAEILEAVHPMEKD